MAYYFNLENKGFYDSKSGVPVPDNAIKITEAQYVAFLTGLNRDQKDLELIDGELTLVDRKETVSWEYIRAKRNKLLNNSDFKIMPDYPSDKEAWMKYRQELRDLPQTYTDPNEVVWPISPDESK